MGKNLSISIGRLGEGEAIVSVEADESNERIAAKAKFSSIVHRLAAQIRLEN
jgi:hypothetical protein